MVISLKHSFTSPKSDGTDTTLVQPSNWNAEHVLTMASNRLVGRTTASAGAAEEITVGSNLVLASGALSLASSVSITALTLSGVLSSTSSITAASLATGGTLSVTGAATLAGAVNMTGTGAVKVPSGTTAQRPTAAVGQFRFNSDLNSFEGYNGTAWGAVGGGAKGAGSNAVFYENDQTVTGNYTITSGKNAMSAGPITINSGITVTIPSGSVWTII